ncbi:acyl carrier protein [Chromohalobacter beijerinckii]|uniref:Acyl carrier protein n=1 Tax=Chromohalobacter beijerinckii TaxID=86179 RepID=A0ABV8XII6_9GAMM|nr:acyl carrier protein [Chromohalobacter beijerinckii]
MTTDSLSQRENIYQHVRQTLAELFEIDAAEITPQARLYEDLDIDSIDAVDLVVELKKYTGRRIDPSDFKSVRTIDDVVSAVEQIMQR